MQKDNYSDIEAQPPHYSLSLKIHLTIGAVLLILAFIGVLLTNWQSTYTHTFWLILTFVYAATSLGLSWFTAPKDSPLTAAEALREILHWTGLFVSVYLVEHFREMGIFSTPVASLIELLLLALTSFLAGVHFNSMFILLGIFLGLIAFLSVIIFDYLSLIVLPVLIIFMAILWWQLRRKHNPEI